VLGESRVRLAFSLSWIAVACGSASGEALFSGGDVPGGGGAAAYGGFVSSSGGNAGAHVGRGGSATGGVLPNSGGALIGGAGGTGEGGSESGGSESGGAPGMGGAGSGGAPGMGGARTGGTGSGGKVVAAPTCTDGSKNGDETATDCGGSTCPACGPNQACIAARDCASGVCLGLLLKTCRAATCADSVKNGTETDVDCGGSCTPCANGHPCRVAGDCTSGACENDVCICKKLSCDTLPHACGNISDGCGGMLNCRACSALCSNGAKDGNETAMDCGGPDCKACSDGLTCLQARDCTSHVCKATTGTTLTCRTPTCNDQTKNAAETDVDCGGGACPACHTGQVCKASTDCAEGPCSSNKCTCAPRICGATDCGDLDDGCGGVTVCQPCADLCGDKVLDGNETDVDCGGPDCDPCPLPP
jgi:hypothetical protein